MNDRMLQGRASFTLRDPRPHPVRDIPVYTYQPSGFTPDSPVLIVMHGRKRNGEEYREQWVETAERHGFLVGVPEFSDAQYPHPHEYNYGSMLAADGSLRLASEWIFPVIDDVFREVRRRAGSNRERYTVYGHSAGGQLVHRLATFAWSPLIERAVSANAGSYTMPTTEETLPFGIRGTGVGDTQLRAFFTKPLLVMLGDQDIDPDHSQLPREPAAMRQGPHRFARGHRYLEVAKQEADRLGVPLAWRIAIAPGVAHDNRAMAPHVGRELFGAKS
jgi:poly(3-hydroxybutyrate) depolymerase